MLAPGIGGSMTPAPGHIPSNGVLAPDQGMPPVLQDYMEPERSDPETGMPIGPNYGVLMVDRAGHQKYSQERERLKALKEQLKP